MNDITLKEVKQLLNINHLNSDTYIHSMIPVTTVFIRDYCENPTMEFVGGARIALCKIIEFYMHPSNLKSRSISRLNESFLLELPESILILLKPYDNTNKVIFL